MMISFPFSVNWLIWMNCLTIRYNLIPIQAELSSKLNFNELEIGVLISFFYLPFNIFSFIFGILGDRYNRKNFILFSLIISIFGLLLFYASEIFTQDQIKIYNFYKIGRILIAIGQAGSITISPTIVADMFTDAAERSTKMGIYSVSGIVGATLSFAVTPMIASSFGYRNVFVMNILVEFLLLFGYWYVPNYNHGQGESLKTSDKSSPPTLKVILQDVKYILSIKTFVMMTVALFFATGGVETGATYMNEIYRRQLVYLLEEPICSEDMLGLDSEILATYSIQINQTETEDLLYFETCENLTHYLDQFPNPRNTISYTISYDCQDCISIKISATLGIISAGCSVIGALTGIYLYKTFYTVTRKSGCLVGCFGAFSAATVIFSYYLKASSLEISSAFEMWMYAIFLFTLCSMGMGILLDSVNRVVLPNKRSLSIALQNLFGMLSGSFFPYLAGSIIETKTEENMRENFGAPSGTLNLLEQNFLYQQIRLLSMIQCMVLIGCCFVLGGVLWILAAFYWADDEDSKNELLENS